MKKKNGFRTFLWIFLGLLILGTIGYFSLGFTVIGNLQTQSFCQNYVKNTWCAEGYSCTACNQVTLPFSLRFDDGTVTNKAWTSDCTYGTTPLDSAHNYCQQPANIVSHAKSHCSNGNVYWYNSIGVKEDIKSTCSNGCTDTSLDYASCNAAPTPTPTGTKVCMPGTNYLCNNALYSGGTYLCNIDDKIYCSYGCSNNKCNPQSCTNDCDTNGYVECTADKTGFRQCTVGADKCLHWNEGFSCPTNQICSAGRCVAKTDTTTPPPSTTPDCTDYGQSKCITQYSYQSCSSTGKLSNIIACDDGYKCESGSCNKVTQPPPEQSGNTDICANVDCRDRCEGTVFETQGKCSNGNCVWGHTEYNSQACMTTNGTNDNNPSINNAPTPNIIDKLFNFEDKTGYWTVGLIAAMIIVIALLLLTRKKN